MMNVELPHKQTVLDAINRHIDYIYYEKIPGMKTADSKKYYEKELRKAQEVKIWLEQNE